MCETWRELKARGNEMMKTGRGRNCPYPEDDWANRDGRDPSAAARDQKVEDGWNKGGEPVDMLSTDDRGEGRTFSG